MKIFGQEVTTFEELENLVIEELESSDRWIDEYGSLPTIDDIDDLHDLLEGDIEEEDYDEFCNLLDKEKDNFFGIEIDTEGIHDAAWDAWYSSRL